MTVYFIGAGFDMERPSVKIGYTQGCPHARLRGLQTGSPILLDLLHHEPGYEREYERALHELFADRWRHGEWFDLNDDVWNFIWMLQSGHALHEMIDPREHPHGLRCDTAMNVGGVYEGVKQANFKYARPFWTLNA